jgi:hypothetical protein
LFPVVSTTFYYLLHGIVQHGLYHAGQIAILNRAVTAGWGKNPVCRIFAALGWNSIHLLIFAE